MIPLLSTIYNWKIYFYIFDFVESQLGLSARPEKFRKLWLADMKKHKKLLGRKVESKNDVRSFMV